MTTLKFADTHNMVAFLAKPAESEGFEQIAKTINGEVQLQALVDGKKIIITESTMRRDLQLEDADGVDCLPNATIFEQLTLMGYEIISQKLTFYKAFFSPQWKFLIHTVLQYLSSKTTAWNEFSSTMASVIICLATNQKFNFSKYIFESMVKNLDNVGKFLMYPRFVQVFLDKQVDGMASHKRIYIAPSHTKKIFGNMKRVGKGFSGMETSLFQTMVVQDQAEMGEGSAIHIDPHHTSTFIQPSTSQPQMKQRSRRPKRKDTQVPQSSVPSDNIADEAVNEEMDDSLVRAATTVTSLDAEHDRGNINKTRSKATLNEPSSPGTSLGSGPRCQETMGDTIAQTRFENVSKHSNDPLLARVSVATTTTTTTAITDVEVTLDQALSELKSTKPKANKVMIQELEQGTTTPTLTTTTDDITITAVSTRPRAKGLIIHEWEQAPLHQNVSYKQHHSQGSDKEEEEERLAREKAQQVEEANIAWDDVQAKIDANYQLAQRLQAQEQDELIDKEKARLFVQLLEQRR
ncbi:hypothetical protein Tco_0842910 [Tanacetum coccineum]|uniref:Synaptobrevin, longin-like domain protein n=1 Tax=Tanacetum coccineum TaxID=301880 RepID=A0ABQ5B4I6_9ASTR